uniref:Uncharacterized protein n=1 Tax=Timema bartmani TaxID=61472 RepID=A0A7R9ETH2_9NEOP|nr:unnamed protein product [Timema bartmani]
MKQLPVKLCIDGVSKLANARVVLSSTAEDGEIEVRISVGSRSRAFNVVIGSRVPPSLCFHPHISGGSWFPSHCWTCRYALNQWYFAEPSVGGVRTMFPMATWVRVSLILCVFGALKEFRPSEPYVTHYLVGPWKNFTDKQVNQEMFPVGTYSYLSQLVVVFLVTDLVRYKPVIVIEGLSGIITWCLLIWGTDMATMQGNNRRPVSQVVPTSKHLVACYKQFYQYLSAFSHLPRWNMSTPCLFSLLKQLNSWQKRQICLFSFIFRVGVSVAGLELKKKKKK